MQYCKSIFKKNHLMKKTYVQLGHMSFFDQKPKKNIYTLLILRSLKQQQIAKNTLGILNKKGISPLLLL